MSMQRSAWCRKIGIMLGKIFVCLTAVRMTLGVWGLWCKKLEHEGNKIISGARCHNRGPGLMYNIAAIFWQHGIWTLTQVIDEDIHKMLARVKVKFGNIKIYPEPFWVRQECCQCRLMTLFNPASTQGSATAVLLCPPARSLSAVFWWDATEVSYSFPIICTNCNELVSWQGPLHCPPEPRPLAMLHAWVRHAIGRFQWMFLPMDCVWIWIFICSPDPLLRSLGCEQLSSALPGQTRLISVFVAFPGPPFIKCD